MSMIDTVAAAEQNTKAAMQLISNRQRPRVKRNESAIVLPFGARISDKPYKRMRFGNKANWWMAQPELLINPEILESIGAKYRRDDGRYCLGWPNSTEEGTTMYLADAHGGFEPVLWKHIDKTKGARVKTHEGSKTREGEGFVYWKRHILVWVAPDLWQEEHIDPILRSLSMLATSADDWAEHVETTSKNLTPSGDVIVVGTTERESEEVLMPR